MSGKKVALKFCGGCNPEFDRGEYYRRIRTAAAESIEWRTLEDGDFETVLLIEGCRTACPEKDFLAPIGRRVISLANEDLEPDEVVKLLLVS